ncbi:MAG: hypothetical protein F6K36_22905 [Symploca sp. SIO3C6]|uniref:Uncharacterized protein n=1 Tax=Symploca sp. SIO1C4 TaxID=2607765 RepID=A0A6B3NP74_9CYAN|nr:hypothetical protein [Symploca sp. SIO3C6]NER31331.1 hypothetical protein [Symploca sp. SIO1C4]
MSKSIVLALTSSNLDRAREAVSRLSREEKKLLLQEILGSAGFPVGWEKSSEAEIAVQIQSGDFDLSQFFLAAAQRVSQERLADID